MQYIMYSHAAAAAAAGCSCSAAYGARGSTICSVMQQQQAEECSCRAVQHMLAVRHVQSCSTNRVAVVAAAQCSIQGPDFMLHQAVRHVQPCNSSWLRDVAAYAEPGILACTVLQIAAAACRMCVVSSRQYRFGDD